MLPEVIEKVVVLADSGLKPLAVVFFEVDNCLR
jgi:hypothetical protein